MFEEISKAVADYGIGVASSIVLIGLFVYLLKETINNNKGNRKEQTEALEKVAQSNNNVAEALSIIKDTFVDRMNISEAKHEKIIDMIAIHDRDGKKIESKCEKMQEMLTQIKERSYSQRSTD